MRIIHGLDWLQFFQLEKLQRLWVEEKSVQ